MYSNLNALLKRVKGSSTARRLAVGSFWAGAGVAIEKAATLIGIILVVRVLGKDQYGLFAIVQSTLAAASTLAALGLSGTATKYIAELKYRDSARLTRILSMAQFVSLFSGGLLFLILATSSSYIANDILGQPDAANFLALASIAVVFISLDGFQSGALLGFEATKKAALGYFFVAIISAPCSVLLAYYFGVKGAIWSVVLTALTKCITSQLILRQCLIAANINISLNGWLQEWRVLRDFAFPLFLSGLLVSPAHWLCHTMLVNSAAGRGEMAVLGVASQWFYSVIFIPMAAGRVLLPVLSDLTSSNNSKKSNQAVYVAMIANFIVMLPVAVLLALCSPYIMKLYGAEFAPHWRELTLAVCSACISAIFMPALHFLTAKNKAWIGLSATAVWALVYVAGSYHLIAKGALGVTSALFLAYLCYGAILMILALRVMSPKQRALIAEL